MPLLKTWTPYFQSHARRRGRACFEQGQVERVAPQPGELIRAKVIDQDGDQTVTLQTDGTSTTALCTCNHQKGGTFCQCIWATLMAVQQENSPFARDASPEVLINPRPPKARRRAEGQTPSRNTEQPAWATRLDLLRPSRTGSEKPVSAIPVPKEICYFICPKQSARQEQLVIELSHRQPTLTGYSRLRYLKISEKTLYEISNPADRELCALLLGAGVVVSEDSPELPSYLRNRSRAQFVLPHASQATLLVPIIQSGRCFLKQEEAYDDDLASPLSWDDGDPWLLWLVGERVEDRLLVTLELRRGDERVPIDQPDLIVGGEAGLVIHHDVVARLDDRGAYNWISQFRDNTWSHDDTVSIEIPNDDIDRFLDRLSMMSQLPPLDLPEGIGLTEKIVQPIPHLELYRPGSHQQSALKNQLVAKVWFAYDGQKILPGQRGGYVPTHDADETGTGAGDNENHPAAPATQTVPRSRVLIHRDTRLETEALAMLWPLGFRLSAGSSSDTGALQLGVRQMPGTIHELINRGWVVTADQQVVRQAGPPSLTVTSGIDWFELRGGVRYQTTDGEEEIPLPDILRAIRAGKTMLPLGDGTQGMLPHQWLRDHGMLAEIGQVEEDHLRFKSTQVVILDSLLSQQRVESVDETFETIRKRIKQFDGITPVEAEPTFQGDLRPYQREGLGWLGYLQWLRIGGILADDMGLGKTVQVLAMLDKMYQTPAPETPKTPEHPGQATQEGQTKEPTHLPTLIVVPRSIVFNWINEAHRFAPGLRIVTYTGTDRHDLREVFGDHDVIVTSYGLMRRDIAELRKHQFAYVVLDEAQAIKNPGSQSAKASRLLQARHRLALTGTPVENHLGDLWSIFEFLNPGMLGSNNRFSQHIRSANHPPPRGTALDKATEAPEEPAQNDPGLKNATTIARALTPFILRRTKQQVLNDLPEKVEQTILCQMGPEQRKIYDQMLDHYRSTLLGQRSAVRTPAQPAAKGRNGSMMMVLEALLRLRQVACHPGLVDPQQNDVPSAKMDVLLDRLADLIEEGHKALVFSQFTSMLALVRKQLDQRGVIYEYLDGQTRDREAVVERFQTDPHCPIFLISLKAGGLGLNLTAAEYVFILDPWWNPAVESQAIDRTHRIGQTRHVFAYRLICQDTVEQRIVDLQNRKRKLADAIIGGQENLLRGITREDLQYLLA